MSTVPKAVKLGKAKGQFYSHSNGTSGHLHEQSPINKSFITSKYIKGKQEGELDLFK